MGFMDSYKRLEKLCGDMLEDERRISAYIDKMYENDKGWNLRNDSNSHFFCSNIFLYNTSRIQLKSREFFDIRHAQKCPESLGSRG